MPEFVRVRDTATGHHVSITAALAESDPNRWQPVKGDAVDGRGRVLPPKFRATKSASASAEVEATTATTTEANEEAQQ